MELIWKHKIKLIFLVSVSVYAFYMHQYLNSTTPTEKLREFYEFDLEYYRVTGETRRLKVPAGYISPAITYQKRKEHVRLDLKLMTLGFNPFKDRTPDSTTRERPALTVFNFDTIYPEMVPKSFDNVHRFINKSPNRKNRLHMSLWSSTGAGELPGINARTKADELMFASIKRQSNTDIISLINKRGNHFRKTEKTCGIGCIEYWFSNTSASPIKINWTEVPSRYRVYTRTINNLTLNTFVEIGEKKGNFAQMKFYYEPLNARIHVTFNKQNINEIYVIEDKVRKLLASFTVTE
jgi:hypothetical protein